MTRRQLAELRRGPVGQVVRELRSGPGEQALRTAREMWDGRPGRAVRRRPAVAALAVGVVLALLGTVVGVASATSGSATRIGTWVAMPPAAQRVTDVQALLERRAEAVRKRDKRQFLASIDRSDRDFVKRQGVVYDNLVQLPLLDLTFRVESESVASYERLVPPDVAARYHSAVYAPGVTIRYRIDGVDSQPVAVPWAPILAYTGGRWVIVGEATGKDLPYGANGQAWDAGPIWVARSARVVAVFSADDARRSSYLLDLAEKSLDRVLTVRPTGWSGKVFVTAVQDRRIFDGYFADSPDRVSRVAAVAVTYYDSVRTWKQNATFAATRIVFNPQQLSAQPDELAHGLTHEFTHAAMAPVANAGTPRWLTEGFAEYVAYKSENVSAAATRKLLRDVGSTDHLPADEGFYEDATNYATSWLACRMIAERYGEPRLVALMLAFAQRDDVQTNISATLGVSLPAITDQWREYLQKQRA